MTQRISFLEVEFLCILFLSGLLMSVPVHAEQNAVAKTNSATNVPVAFQPRDTLAPLANTGKSLQEVNSQLVFSAPPRGAYADEVAIYEPIVQLLDEVKVTGWRVSTMRTSARVFWQSPSSSIQWTQASRLYATVVLCGAIRRPCSAVDDAAVGEAVGEAVGVRVAPSVTK